MSGARWMDFAGQAIFHTLVAALVVEALVRLWKVRDPQQRTGFRLLALVWPLLVVPAYFLLFPGREEESFRDGRALFAGRHWEDLAFLGIGLYGWWILGMSAFGLGLFLLDLVPWMRARGARSPPWLARSPHARPAQEALARAAAALRMEAPPLAWVDEGPPVLFCTGTRRPTVVISRSAVALLDSEELAGALAHELAHLERRDPTLSWALMGARALMGFNPGVQVLVRAIARDGERVADGGKGVADDGEPAPAPLACDHRQRLNRPVGAQFVKHHAGGSFAQSDTFLVGNDQRPAGIPPDDSPHRTGKRRHFDDPAAADAVDDPHLPAEGPESETISVGRPGHD
ncbi:MAG: M56 family metallopeptidase, partial [Deltaproteobacteria bacterium]